MYLRQLRPKLILLDDAPVNMNSLGTDIPDRYEVYYAKDFNELLESSSISQMDCMIIDIESVEMDLMEMCSILKENSQCSEVPLILVGPIYYDFDAINKLGLDGVDVLTKPINPAVLEMRIRFLMNISEEHHLLKYKEDSLKKASKTIQSLERELALKTVRDELSGLINRRTLMEKATHEFKLSQRMSREVTVMMMDLDRFKNINDTFGVEFGDQIITQVGKTCTEVLRETDLIGRMGGDEFAVLLPGTSLENGIFVAEKLRSHVHKINETLGIHNEVSISLSIGISSMNYQMESVEELFRKANQALLLAKKKGRDCVMSI